RAAGAAAVLDQDRLPQGLGHALPHQARDDVRGPASGERDDDAHRLGRKRLRPCDTAQPCQDENRAAHRLLLGSRHSIIEYGTPAVVEHVQRASWKRSKRCNASSIRLLRDGRERWLTQVQRCTRSLRRSRSVLRSTAAAISSPTSTGWAK